MPNLRSTPADPSGNIVIAAGGTRGGALGKGLLWRPFFISSAPRLRSVPCSTLLSPPSFSEEQGAGEEEEEQEKVATSSSLPQMRAGTGPPSPIAFATAEAQQCSPYGETVGQGRGIGETYGLQGDVDCLLTPPFLLLLPASWLKILCLAP